VKNSRWWPAVGSVLLGAALVGCGGGGGSSDTGSVRVINATLTHPSLDLLQNSSSAITGVTVDTASAYTGITTGSPALQLNDTGATTALATTAPTISGGLHYSLLAYESGGSLKTALLTEDFATPTTGTGQIRIYDAAIDAGGIDVYITDPTTDLSTVSAPTTSFSPQTYAQSSSLLSYAPGTYRLRVTVSGNKSQLLLDMPSIVLTNQQIVTIPLTPAAGGILIDGSTIVQQGAYTPARTTSARVRLAAAVSGSVPVSASAGSTTIDSFTLAPAVGSYVVVPVGALNISVNGNSVGAPAAPLKAGYDYTLLVYGNAASPTASLLTDDNHLPTSSTNVKMRLINGVTGTVSGLTLEADFNPVASNIAGGATSTYGTVAANTSMELDVTSALSNTPIYSRTGLSIAGSTVYTLFMVGDSSAPQGLLRRDR
jgi:hypothetical protein